MSDKNWKVFERRVAKYFKTERTPMSGGNSKHTRADSMHPYLFIEAKQRKALAVWGLWQNTKALAKLENKIPVVVQHETGRNGFLITVHSDDLNDFIAMKQLHEAEQELEF